MALILLTLTILTLCILAFQDVRSRTVSWVLMPVLFTCLFFYYPSSYLYPVDLLQKFAFLLLILSLLIVYIKLRKGRTVSVTKSYFGWGDILFLVALIPFGSLFGYLALIVIGTFFTLVLFLLLLLFKSTTKTIPYVGYFALFFIAILILEKATPALVNVVFYG